MKSRTMTCSCRRVVSWRASYLLAAVWLAVLATTTCRADEALKQRLLAEYPTASARLVATLRPSKGDLVLSETIRGETSEFYGEYWFDRGSARLLMQSEEYRNQKWEDVDLVLCGDAERVFALKRRAGGDQWTITDAGQSPASIDELNDRFRMLILAPFSAFNVELRELLASPDYRVEDVSETTRGADRLVAVRYRYVPDPTCHGVVELDPKLGWANRHTRFEKDGAPAQTEEIDIEYGPTVAGVPTLRKVSHRDNDRTYGCVFEKIIREPTDASEFTLARFGLPDPIAPQDQSWPLWLRATAFLAILAAVGGAILTSRWIRRR